MIGLDLTYTGTAHHGIKQLTYNRAVEDMMYALRRIPFEIFKSSENLSCGLGYSMPPMTRCAASQHVLSCQFVIGDLFTYISY